MSFPWIWIDQQYALDAACDTLSAFDTIAIDTEYNSLHYFREKLCLIQIHSGQQAYLIDPFAFSSLGPLEKVFANPQILKVFHAGDNDIRIIKRDYNCPFNCIFDTQRAASLLGHHFLSLEVLVQEYLPVTFKKKKKTQRSRWEIRPLTEEQLHYASFDTLYLIPLYQALKEKLLQEKRYDEAQKVFSDMTGVTWREKKFNPFGYKRLAGYADLEEHQKQRLRRLYRWRHDKARSTDRAAFMIVQDELLLDIARLDPAAPLPSDQVISRIFSQYFHELMPILQK
ncbi:MAG: ribonuclease D [Syntrophobacterales bacterium]|jgi:ribonuclease D|nr:ribonuclease D [Syntrophobacterales bacterium]